MKVKVISCFATLTMDKRERVKNNNNVHLRFLSGVNGATDP